MKFVVVEASLKGKINQICIKDMLHMPKIHANLFSISKFVSNILDV